MRIELEHEFAVPLEAGFAYITDMENWPAFWPGLVRVESGSQWRVPGDEARVVVKLLGREVELQLRLRQFEQNRLVEYESRQDGLPDARHERRFDGADGRFRYRLAVEYEPRPGLRGVYDRLLVRRGVERALHQTVANLERTLPR